MSLRAAFADHGLAFTAVSAGRNDTASVSGFASRGGEVLDDGGLSYASLPRPTDYTVDRLAGIGRPFDLTSPTVPATSSTQYSLSSPFFGQHTLLLVEGPRVLASSDPCDTYTAWMSQTGRPLSHQLQGDWIPEGLAVYDSRTARGAIVAQALQPSGDTVRSTLTLVEARVQPGNGRGAQAGLVLYAGKLISVHPRVQRFKVNLPADWHAVCARAIDGFQRFCKPSAMAPATAQALVASLTDFRKRADACQTWQEALDAAATLDEFRVAVELWAPRAGFTGTLYKQTRRLAEAYLRHIADSPRRVLVEAWWGDLKAELRPTA